jgi:hypothetical protein
MFLLDLLCFSRAGFFHPTKSGGPNMDLLSGYGSDASSESPAPVANTILKMHAAPAPSISYRSQNNAPTPQSSKALVLVDQGENKLASNMQYAFSQQGPAPGPQVAPVKSGTFKQHNWNEGNVGAAGVYKKVRRGEG